MISSLDDGNMVLKFIQKGVRNYIMKDEMLIDSVKEVFMEEL
jgi:PleD family two-component response regulator